MTAYAMGIDASLSGFAIAMMPDDDTLPLAWHHAFSGAGTARLAAVRKYLNDHIMQFTSSGVHTIEDVALEDTVRSSFSSLAMGELAATVKLTLYDSLMVGKGRTPLRVPPNTLKKFATGRGNAKKNEVLLSCYKKWGMEFRDDNEADAYVLSRISAGLFDNAYEEEILLQLQDDKFRDVV